jgi:hypothetical protein
MLRVLRLDIESLGEQSKSDWFFWYLASQPDSEIRLPCLRMGQLHEKELPFLVECLPKTSKLQELTIQSMYKYTGKKIKADSFLAAVRSNGSLHTVAVGARNGRRAFLTPAQWRYAQGCTDRNRVTPTLLADLKLNRHLFPCLFAAAQAAKRTAPGTMLIGLLAHDAECWGLSNPIEMSSEYFLQQPRLRRPEKHTTRSLDVFHS